MIMDNLYTSHVDYGQMSVKLDKAFSWLRANDLKSFQPGQKIVIDGDRIHVQVQGYDSLQPHEARFEAHRSYIDIQIVVSGREIIYWAPLASLTEIDTAYNYEKDIVYFKDPQVSVPLTLQEGDYAVFFPTDGHKPRCNVSQSEPVGKIVVKIAV